MNKITINSNLVRGRLDTIPTEEGGETSRNFQVLFFPDECPPPPKNWIKLTNSLDPFRVHASIFEAECILIRRNRSIATARNVFQKMQNFDHLDTDTIPNSSNFPQFT